MLTLSLLNRFPQPVTTSESKLSLQTHPRPSLYWAPLFSSSFLTFADFFLLFHQELNKYQAKCSMLFHYDWISIPLVLHPSNCLSPPTVSVPIVCSVCETQRRIRDGTCPGVVQISETLNSQRLILKASLDSP